MLEIMTIPLQVNDGEYIIVIALPQSSIDRIKKRDPAEIPVNQMGEPFDHLRLRDVYITYYDEKDDQVIRRKVAEYDIKGALEVLRRGWAYRPELGDNNLPPMNIKPVN